MSHGTRPRISRSAATWPLIVVACAWLLQGCNSGASTQQSPTPQVPPPTTPPPTTPPPTVGLDARPQNTTCLAWARPTSTGDISLAQYTSLTFASPVLMLQPPNDSTQWFVVEQSGVVRRFATASPTSSSVYVDIDARVESGGEKGLLGMAFHPNFPTNPHVYLSYTSREGTQLVSRISAFTINAGGATLNAGSEVVLMRVNQPQDNHNGGHIAFGPDGYLYIGLGDGGGGGDAHGNPGNGQRLTTLLGKMLRIDVDSASPYGIPPSNPFALNGSQAAPVCPAEGRASDECPEIYAWGFRNPWRWSFDRSTGELWVGDVGQDTYEEVDRVTINSNYGWRCREGAHDFNSGGTTGCSAGGLIDPETEYDHSQGASITGGYVYRGAQTTNLVGRYLFADFSSGRIWAWIPENATTPRLPTQLLDSSLTISSFGEGNDGELYIVSYGGALYRIVFDGGSGSGAVPTNLSATGCVSASDAKQPASGLIPYAVNAPFWSDGAEKDRWIGLPGGQNITVQTSGDWDFPNSTVLMKNFRLGTRLVETRLFMRHPDGNWAGYSYEWNAQQTDATLVPNGAVRDLGNGQNWIFPSGAQCLECHTSAAGRALGLETAQLNRDFTYPQTGRTANELATLNAINTLTPPITDPSTQPTMSDPGNPNAPLVNRARAYLHTNCSQCHRPGGPTPSTMDLRYTTALSATNACNAVPQSGELGLGANARLIVPGNAANSILVNRMNRRDQYAMPPLGSNIVDAAGVTLLTTWVDSLIGC